MYEFDRAEPVTLSLRAVAGRVEIDAGHNETTQVEVTPLDDSPQARQAAESARVLLDGDILTVAVPNPERWRWRHTAALLITVKIPEGSTISGATASAGVRATGRYRDVHLKLASADGHVAEVLGNVHLAAASGDLSVGRAGGSAYLKSGSGQIRVGDVTGDVMVNTASGDISVASAGGSLAAGSASGDIAIGSLCQGKTRIRTASGNVTVGVAPGTGVWLDLNTAGGHSVTDLAARGHSAPATGGPGLDLRVRTASGDIRIHRAAGPGTAPASGPAAATGPLAA